ncbi:putative toxin-antitoxin system toxin component, PIN family [Candidatus Aerophobetes bacterium]|nr:putative toxin-antitoxin system toxin component, PIN family [Candidatus Aerophobetes bacterium]
MLAENKTFRPKVVIDTNVFFSGLNFKGAPREVLDLIWRGEIEVYISPFILKELRETLEKDFDWGRERIETTIERIKKETIQVAPTIKISVIKQKEADNRILECGVGGKVRYIVSGDKRHLLPLKEYKGIKIVSPAQFLSIIFRETSSGSF